MCIRSVPPTTHRAVSGDYEPALRRAGTGNRFYESEDCFCDCIACGGSGVVEATTIHGLASLGRVRVETPIAGTAHKAISSVEGFKLVDLAAVALPEDGE